MTRIGLFLLFVCSFFSSGALAEPVPVGSGGNVANVVINFKDGAAYEFVVSFDGTKTGIGLFDVVEAHTALDTVRATFGNSTFIDGISYEGHSNVGFGGGEDWWHYWTREDDASPWASSTIGAGERVVAGGAWDGWVYGTALPPAVPEPVSLALIGAAMVILARRRRTLGMKASGVGLAVTVGMAMGADARASYVFDASDFATEVVEYVEGTGVGTDFLSGQRYDDPANALGRPTVDTTGDAYSMPEAERVPAVPVYGAWRAHELVTVGQGGRLIVKFDHRVMNDPANPYGLDLLVFGNSFAAADPAWHNRDPDAVRVGGAVPGEGGTVSVSQDGVAWHAFAGGPFADAFAPTLGRVYDPANPDPAVGTFNQWWGAATDPTRPLDPAIAAGSFGNKTIAEVALLYGRSAGGSGLDIGVLGLDWIQYVKVESAAGSGMTPDVDAFADVAAVPEPTMCIALTFLLSLAVLRRE
jgi:hypothetical protein